MPKHKWVQHILHICQRDDWWMTSKRSTIIQTQCERSLTHFAAFTLPSQRFGTLLAAFTWLAHRSAKCYGNHWTLTHYALNVCGEMNDPWGTPPLESGIKIWTQHRRLTYVSTYVSKPIVSLNGQIPLHTKSLKLIHIIQATVVPLIYNLQWQQIITSVKKKTKCNSSQFDFSHMTGASENTVVWPRKHIC